MADLSTKYMGLDLANPLIVGSSSLTQSLERARQCAEAGAGAVVLKSVFEEQIEREVAGLAKESAPGMGHSEAMDYILSYGRESAVDDYLDLIRDTSRELEIPVLASVHCTAAGSWTEFAARAEKAGADALELNTFVLPADPKLDGRAVEQVYLDILEAVKSKVSIPVALKVGPHFSGLAQMMLRLSRKGADALVLFNRFYRLDFDIEAMKVIPAGSFSSPEEMVIPLRWISILSGVVECDLAATTGVHDGAGLVKQLLAGAAAVQVVSALYRKDLTLIAQMLKDVREWMDRHGFADVASFRGKMSREESEDPAVYERVQFMRFSLNAP